MRSPDLPPDKKPDVANSLSVKSNTHDHLLTAPCYSSKIVCRSSGLLLSSRQDEKNSG
ncbi:hypothetical protein GOB81_15225 [Acetobacter sp. LMG 1627]|uniref:Uncharacterized protein n=1 Tax=Acetobacter conturbans TaxID=1737472 RepID=A0ABX0K402_9PROT|nr:hypothetical protein [Acetobacter conturbans]